MVDVAVERHVIELGSAGPSDLEPGLGTFEFLVSTETFTPTGPPLKDSRCFKARSAKIVDFNGLQCPNKY